jgi:ElaB/YqjD/DUF883 family membrane-anchored ribosome-binding protein
MSQITKEKLFADFKVLVEDAGQLVSATAGGAGERIAQLRQHMARRVEEGKAALAQREKELREQVQQVKSGSVTFLRDEQWGRVVIFAGIGVLLGLALRCRKRGSRRSEQ